MGAITVALVCLLAGITGGVVSSAPIGPINLWVADVVLRDRGRALAGFLAGVILCDLGYAALATWGYDALAEDPGTAGLLSLLAGSVLIVLGLLMSAREGAARSVAPPRAVPFRPARQFLLGIIMMGSNPAFLMFWVFMVDLVSSQIGSPIRSWLLAAFLAGVILGDALWFAFLTRMVRSGSALLGAGARERLQRMLALGFLAAGIFALMRGLTSPG